MNTVSKTDAVLSALRAGETLTAKQIRARFGFASTNSVRGTITNLRREGFPIFTNQHVDTKGRVTNKYRLGTAPRAVIAAGYQALSEMGVRPFGA